jgi:hypothetical protein
VRKLGLADWSALAQIIGAMAVVISLVYVGFELRANTAAVQAAALQSVNQIARDQILLYATNPELNRISMQGAQDTANLNGEDRVRYRWLVRSFWLGMQTIYRQWQLGILPDEEWAVYYNVVCANVAMPGVRALWIRQRAQLVPSFARVVDSCSPDALRSVTQ